MTMALICRVVVVRSDTKVEWNFLTLMVAALAVVPLLQFAAGLISFAGQAWIASAYLLGLSLAMLTGQSWERVNKDQCANTLFLAIGFACLVSVSLQLQTWLGLQGTELTDVWSMGLKGERAYANVGQPNQLGTLLLWGVLAAGWAYQNNKVGGPVATLIVSFLLLGVALTMSRTAWLGLSFLLLCTWLWRDRWKSRLLPWVSLALFALFWIYPVVLKWISDILFSGPQPNYLRVQFEDETRFLALQLFAKAILASPWVGYGWSEVGKAQLAVAEYFPGLGSTFGQSHNLFVDLLLWLGIPLGMLVIVAVATALIAYVRAIKGANDLLLVMFLGVIGIHAMIELPLHYAYFLLPTGMVLGVLNVRAGFKPIWRSSRWQLGIGCLLAVLLLGGIVRDYLRVESSYQSLRFERARVGSLPIGEPPDVLLLTQMRELIRFLRYSFPSDMTDEELNWTMEMARNYPGAANIYKVASALAIKDRPEEASTWLRKACKFTNAKECAHMRNAWRIDAEGNRQIALVRWPE